MVEAHKCFESFRLQTKDTQIRFLINAESVKMTQDKLTSKERRRKQIENNEGQKANRKQISESTVLQLADALPLATVVHAFQCPALDNLK